MTLEPATHGPGSADGYWHVPLFSTHAPGAAGTVNFPATRKWEHLAHVSAHRGVSRRTSSNGFRKLPICSARVRVRVRVRGRGRGRVRGLEG